MAHVFVWIALRLAITTAVVEDAADATAITRPGYARDPTAAEALVATPTTELAPVTTHAKQAPGSATAAITEQLLCASAATVVMCNRRGACACGRGLDSGFVSAIKFYRARMGLSVRGDAAGGIFSF